MVRTVLAMMVIDDDVDHEVLVMVMLVMVVMMLNTISYN